MKYSLLVFASVALVASLFAGGGDFRFPVRVTVEQGKIEGSYDTKTGIHSYLGVPFARPPVGDLRWKAPQPLKKWEGVRAAKKFGPRPMQPPIYSDMIFESDGISEDCLYLNVWTPAKRATTGLPVLVYFYGGGFGAGDGSEPRYNGASMAGKGIVTVTTNYRLNVFGFLAHPELSAEAPHKASGNYGLLDQQAALAWVQKNIAAFGGDPKKVTIAGESAGSASVSYHMVSPLSKKLFARAIGESGSGIRSPRSLTPLAEAEQMGREFLAKAGVASIAEAKKLSALAIYEIYEESKRLRLPVVLDGYFLKKSLPETFSAREQAQVPLLIGWNSAESDANAFMQGRPYEKSAYVAQVKESFPSDHEQVLQLYPHESEQEIEMSATALASDRFIGYSTYRWFDLHRKNSEQPVYRYLYSKLRPPLKAPTPQMGATNGDATNHPARAPAPKALGAPHSAEIEYCLGNLPLIPDYVWTEDDFKVSQTMQNYFANFIKTGNPNGEGLVEWPASPAEDPTPPVMVIDTVSEVRKAENDGRYQLLHTVFSRKD